MIHTDTPNAFDILAQVKLNMKLAGIPREEANLKFSELFDKATAGDYENLVELCSQWLDVEAIKEEMQVQENSPLFNQIYSQVQIHGVSEATVLDWIKNYPPEQINTGVNYVLKVVKDGDKTIQNIVGYFDKMVGTASLMQSQ